MYLATRYFLFLQAKKGHSLKKGAKMGLMPDIWGAQLIKGHCGNPAVPKFDTEMRLCMERMIQFLSNIY